MDEKSRSRRIRRVGGLPQSDTQNFPKPGADANAEDAGAIWDDLTRDTAERSTSAPAAPGGYEDGAAAPAGANPFASSNGFAPADDPGDEAFASADGANFDGDDAPAGAFASDDAFLSDRDDAPDPEAPAPRRFRRPGGRALQPAGEAGPDVEELQPAAFWDLSDELRREKRRKRRRGVLVAILGLVVVLFGGAFFYLRSLMDSPASFFDGGTSAVLSAAATATPGGAAILPPDETPVPTVDPYTALSEQADLSMMQNIVNIMLIGVDYAEERETWSGKNGLTASHADVMIVLAVNFDNNTASMISLPRDTYTTVPGVSGIYKLNAALDCGGGLNAANGAGFLKVCEAASSFLGGIPVNYYYAVTMPAVKELVNTIGGVDFELDLSFTLQGRSYTAGFQHMDGQAVLDYLRVRKSSSGLSSDETGDGNRVNRQKRMLIAIFEKIQKEGLMAKIPDILSAFSGQLFTNCNTSQTAALALYGYNMPSENIKMYSMSGPTKNLYTWNFCFPKPDNRKNVISEVYGVSVGTIRECTKEYAVYLYNSKLAEQALKTCDGLSRHVAALIAADDLLPALPLDSPTPDPYGGLVQTPDPGQPSVTSPPNPGATPTPFGYVDDGTIVEGARSSALSIRAFLSPVRADGYRQYTDEQRLVYQSYLTAYTNCENTYAKCVQRAKSYLSGGADSMDGYDTSLADAVASLQSAAESCAATFGYGALDWDITPLAKTNEIYVDFR